MMNRIYLDNAATTSLDPDALREMTECLAECYGNASGIYATGREARRRLEAARKKTAAALGAQAQEIYFTSGGSESDNWAIKGTAFANREKGRHLITSSVEHHAVLRTCQWLEKQGFEITYLPVDGQGRVDPETVRKMIRSDTVLISVMAANNEIGTIQPISEIGEIARKQGILFHTDAVQAVGAMPLNMSEMNVDLMSISGHKFHGPKGTGVLYIRNGTRIDRLIHGGAQERGLRAGTENVAGAAGLAETLEKATAKRAENAENIAKLRDLLIRGIQATVPDAILNGDPVSRLPGNAHFTFPGVDGEALLLRLDLMGIACSGGSACTTGITEPSHVLAAIGQGQELSRGGLRMTLGDQNTEEEVHEVLRVLPGLIRDLRGNL